VSSYDPKIHKGRLQRLDDNYYRGQAFVHWTMTIEVRAKRWLNREHHARLRELLCHALCRFRLLCPAYCLMPDHGHFLWVGSSATSHQKRAATLFRTGWNEELGLSGRKLQRQSFDHVLREKEREHFAFSAVSHYILENPVRAGMAANWKTYPFSGALVPGYPGLDPRMPDFWERFWKISERCTVTGESLTASATRAPPQASA
jgi:putative transposase